MHPAQPSSARQELGNELRQRRIGAGLTGHALAAALSCDQSRISRIESGRVKATHKEVQRWLLETGASDKDIDWLLGLADRSLAERIQWKGAYIDGWSARQYDYAAMEAEAATSLVWQFTVVPEIFQTEAYSHHLIVGIKSHTERQFKSQMNIQLARQRALERGGVRIEAVIAEHVLRQRLGGVDVMTEQLDRVVSTARWNSVDLAVLPSDIEMDAIPEADTVIHLPSKREAPIIALPESSHFAKQKSLGRPASSMHYVTQFRTYQRHSWRGDQAIEFVEGLAREMRAGKSGGIDTGEGRNGS